MIVTIDGPAGTGKSTAARALAERLGFSYLDTGAMYRAVGLVCLRRGIDLTDELACETLVRALDLRLSQGRVIANGADVTDDIRSAEATSAASVVAQLPAVRSALVEQQRRIAAGGDFVCEGRDQGTVAFPNAEFKFFITAAPEVRAERRRQELAAKGETLDLAELLRQQSSRDRRDQERSVAPLRPAADAMQIDTTSLTSDDVVDRMEQRVRGGLSR
jgi:cytidylate kinase